MLIGSHAKSAKSVFDTVTRAFAGKEETKKRFTMSGEFSDEDIETIQGAITGQEISIEASKAALEYYPSFSNVDNFLTELDKDPNWTFSKGEKEDRDRMWKRYYLNSEQISRNDITDADIAEDDGLDAMFGRVLILRPALWDDVTTIKRCFDELRTKISTAHQSSAE